MKIQYLINTHKQTSVLEAINQNTNDQMEGVKQIRKRNVLSKSYLNILSSCNLLSVIIFAIISTVLLMWIKDSHIYASIKVIYKERFLNNETIESKTYAVSEVSNGNDKYHFYYYDQRVISQKNTVILSKCSNISTNLRFDCYPETGASQSECLKRGCCWDALGKESGDVKDSLNIPFCYYPENWHLYEYQNISRKDDKYVGFLQKISESPYKNNIPLIKMEATLTDGSTLHVKMFDPKNKRFEPPWPVTYNKPSNAFKAADRKYKFYISDDHLRPGFKVERSSDNTSIFDSIGIGGFVFADQFLQISGLLPSHNIYGIGEHQTRLKLQNNWQIFTLFNKDQPPTENANLYGSHPFYIVMEKTGNCHGVLFLNSNAMDVILQPAPAVTFRSIGGIFDMYFLLGPTPVDVIRQYSNIVGKPFLPPYWSLGFHLCRYGYGSLEGTKEVWNRTRVAEIPFDTQWNDLDYMQNNNDFTYDKNKFKDLPQFVNELHSLGMHYIPLIDAGISGSEKNGSYRPLDEGLREDIFVKDGLSNTPFVGKVWNKESTVWPDFTNPKTKDYYLKMMNDMHSQFPYDGAWIDMNEPSNFYNGHKNGCVRNELDYPQYLPHVIGDLLATKTLCMNAKHYLGSHYNLHNTYGTSQTIATNYALTVIRKKRPFIISRSTWVGHGSYGGHWSGDVYSSWHDMRMSIPEMLVFNFYQIPMIGSDICGFNGNTTVALCNRWTQLGAFYPFSRNHNSDDTIEQDPVAMGDLVIRSAKKALLIRYSLLPYLYSLFFRAHKFGETVVRPLFFEFPNDATTYDIDAQFLWGSSLMIIPVLEEGKTDVSAYLPHARWYDYYERNFTSFTGEYIVLSAPLDTIPLLIRGGSIIPTQKANTTTTASRKNGFELLIALDEFGEALGELYWDDGDSLDSVKENKYIWQKFTVQNQTLTNTYLDIGLYDGDMFLDDIVILGVDKYVSRVFVNNERTEFYYNASKSYFSVTKLRLNMKKRFILAWE